MKQALLILVVLAGMAHPAAAGSLLGGRCMLPMLGLAFSTVNSLMVTPGTISFLASNPNGGPVSGSSAATVNWSVVDGAALQTWNISVQATASVFSGCTTVPVSAVTVSCASASVGGGGTGTCGGSFTLSTVAQHVAGGAQGVGTQPYNVQLNYTLAESWRYVANPSCSLTLIYTVNAL